MSNHHLDVVATQSQKLVTNPVTDLIEFDFTAIGGTAKVYIAKDYEGTQQSGVFQEISIDFDNDGADETFTKVDFKCGGFKNDLMGTPNEPTLTVAVEDLWNVTGWAAATSGFSLRDYRGLVVNRKRMFYGIYYRMIPQRFFVKSVESMTATQITFQLSGSLDSENLNRPSARKLEK